MKSSLLYFFTILLILLVSCEKELNIDMYGIAPQLVINSKVFQDSTFKVDVYRTALVTENHINLWYIDSAKVNLYSDSVFIETLQLKELGRYTGQYRAKPNTHYEIKVEVNGYPSATTSTKTLDKVQILRLDSLGMSIDPETKETIFNFSVRFKDDAENRNYYMIDFTQGREIGGSTSSIYSKDPAIEIGGEGFAYGGYGAMYFSDELFNGEEYSLSICVPEYEAYGGFTVNLCHVTPEYFKYIQTYNAQSEADGMEMFFQAVQVYNNVKNGLGIFGVLSSYTQHYKLEWTDESGGRFENK